MQKHWEVLQIRLPNLKIQVINLGLTKSSYVLYLAYVLKGCIEDFLDIFCDAD